MSHLHLEYILIGPRSKSKKNPPQKIYLIFREMELSSSNLKKKKINIKTLRSQKMKRTHSKKPSYALVNGIFQLQA